MAAVAYTFTDLKNAMLLYCGELNDGGSSRSIYDQDGRAMAYLTKAYLSILAGATEYGLEVGAPWPWALASAPGTIRLMPYINTLTAIVTQGSTAITLSGIPTDADGAQTSVAGWHLQIGNSPEWYRVSTHTLGAVAAVLDAKVTDTTGTAASVTLVKLEYLLAPTNGILRLVAPLRVNRAQDYSGNNEGIIEFTDTSEMLRAFPMSRLTSGIPTQFSISARTADGQYTLRMNKYVATTVTRVEYDYIAVPAVLVDNSSDTPIIPVQHRDVLAVVAAHKLLVDKSDSKAPVFEKMAKAQLQAMTGAYNRERLQASSNRGRLFPRLDQMNNTKRFVVQETS